MKVEFDKADLPRIKKWLFLVPAAVSLRATMYWWDNVGPEAHVWMAVAAAFACGILSLVVYADTRQA
jgi:hypothetical protein